MTHPHSNIPPLRSWNPQGIFPLDDAAVLGMLHTQSITRMEGSSRRKQCPTAAPFGSRNELAGA